MNIFSAIFLVFFLVWPCFCHALTNQEMTKIIMEIAEPSKTDLLFYRYGSFIERTRASKGIPFTINDVNRGGQFAGKGLYVAENPLSNALYGNNGPSDDTELVTVRVKKGIPLLDLTSRETIAILKKNGISVEQVYRLDPPPPILLKYSGIYSDKSTPPVTAQELLKNYTPPQFSGDKIRLPDNGGAWWVLKTNKNISIEAYPPPEVSAEEARKIAELTYRHKTTQKVQKRNLKTSLGLRVFDPKIENEIIPIPISDCSYNTFMGKPTVEISRELSKLIKVLSEENELNANRNSNLNYEPYEFLWMSDGKCSGFFRDQKGALVLVRDDVDEKICQRKYPLRSMLFQGKECWSVIAKTSPPFKLKRLDNENCKRLPNEIESMGTAKASQSFDPSEEEIDKSATSMKSARGVVLSPSSVHSRNSDSQISREDSIESEVLDAPKLDSDFPAQADLFRLKLQKKLPGSTGALLVKIKGKDFVLKKGASKKHIESEYLASQIYRVLGAPTAESVLYKDTHDSMMMSVYIPGLIPVGTKLWQLQGLKDPTQLAKLIKEVQRYYVLDSLLANYDVVGPSNDNIQVDPKGNVLRIDTGGALEYRARGEKKPYSEDATTDLKSMARHNPQYFENIPKAEIIRQIRQIKNKEDLILEQIQDEGLSRIIKKRIESLVNYQGQLMKK
jgi:hypothetical protein